MASLQYIVRLIMAHKMQVQIPVVLDVEAIRVLKPGKYELDLVHLFKGEPLIFQLEEGKYMIDLVESFKRIKKTKKK